MAITSILHYFNPLAPRQQMQLQQLVPLYQAWNTRINLISRKDIANLNLRHVLYSLSIAKVITFKPGTKILDVGTGGGFPGIPLAILFPQVHFHLIDSVGKKIQAVQGIAQTLGLKNVTTQSIRVEVLEGAYDFVLGRAVTNLVTFYTWVKDRIATYSQHEIPNGILYLKGNEAIDRLLNYRTYAVGQFFREPFFQTKQLVHIYP